MGWRKWIGVALSVVLCVGLFAVMVQAEEGLTPPAEDTTAYDYFIELTGSKQGSIKSTRKDGLIPVINFSHGVASVMDSSTGLPTGKRQHKPLTVLKRIDRTSPLLYKSMIMGEMLTPAKFQVMQYHPATASYSVIYVITLTDAFVLDITQRVDDQGIPYEEVSFVYQAIEWTWVDGSINTQDKLEPVLVR